MNRFQVISLVFAGFSIEACRSAPVVSPGSAPTPATVSSGEESTLPSRNTWRIKPTLGVNAQYELRQEASITSREPSKTTQQLPVQMGTFSLNVSQANAGYLFEVTVTRISPLPEDAPDELPISIRAHSAGGQTSISLSSRTKLDKPACAPLIGALLPGLATVALTVPPIMTTGMTWSDTLSTSGCAGTVATTSRTVRVYRVTGEKLAGIRSGIAISFEEQTSAEGDGTEGQHRVRINAAGTGKGQLTVDSIDGLVLDATLEEKSQVHITASGREQIFEQTVVQSVNRSNK